jgi:hypothetical protein
MIKTESKVIGGHTYHVTQLPCGRSRVLLLRLFKVAGPAIGKLLDSGGGKVSELEGKAIGDALAALAYGLNEQDLEFVVDQCFGDNVTVELDGKKPRVTKEFCELHFAGALDEFFKVIGFVLEVNYRSFFGGAGGVLGVVSRIANHPAQSASPSP